MEAAPSTTHLVHNADQKKAIGDQALYSKPPSL